MFGFSSLAAVQLFQGSAQRTWNCVSQFTNLLWYKFHHLRHPIMPRSRRRHHSKSRSRSHSHDRDRDVKRRKVEGVDSPLHKRSVSSQRAHRSRQYERGSSAERRYKRSHRRSPTSKKRHRHRHDRSQSRRKHSRRSYSSDQVSIQFKFVCSQKGFVSVTTSTVRLFNIIL